jgi:hypothetical protein
MVSAFYDFNRLSKEYHNLKTDITELDAHARSNGEQNVNHYIANPFESHDQAGLDLTDLRRQILDIEDGRGLDKKANYIEAPFENKGGK